jgi:HAD superfamily hydrolase (TIGR01509 family)
MVSNIANETKRALVFDMDGTLIDTTESAYQSVLHLIEPYDVEFSVHHFMLLSCVSDYELNAAPFLTKLFADALQSKTPPARLMQYLRETEATEQVALEQLSQKVIQSWLDLHENHYQSIEYDLMPGALELLDWAKAEGYILALATNSDRYRAEVLMEKTGLAGYFEYMAFGDEVAARKPNPEMCLKLLAQMGIEGAQSVFVEDSAVSLKAGIEADMHVIQVKDLFPLVGKAMPHVHQAECLSEVKGIIQSIFA